MATASKPSAVTCARRCHCSGSSSVSAEGVGGRVWPRAACIEARKGRMRCNTANRKLVSQPPTAASTNKGPSQSLSPPRVSRPSLTQAITSASAAAPQLKCISQPLRPRSRRRPACSTWRISRTCQPSASAAQHSAARRRPIASAESLCGKAASAASATAASAAPPARRCRDSSGTAASVNIGNRIVDRPSTSKPIRPNTPLTRCSARRRSRSRPRPSQSWPFHSAARAPALSASSASPASAPQPCSTTAGMPRASRRFSASSTAQANNTASTKAAPRASQGGRAKPMPRANRPTPGI